MRVSLLCKFDGIRILNKIDLLLAGFVRINSLPRANLNDICADTPVNVHFLANIASVVSRTTAQE